MGFWVYILECADGRYYTGHTDDLEKRVYEHQQDLIRCYTSTRLPVRLVYSAQLASREEALARERQIKGWSRQKKRALISGDWERLVTCARAGANRPPQQNDTRIGPGTASHSW